MNQIFKGQWEKMRGERDALREWGWLSPSELCQKYNVQKCHCCESIECGDNMSEAKKIIQELRKENEKLKYEEVKNGMEDEHAAE